MEKLDSYMIALLSRFTKTLVIELSPFGYETRSQIIAHILPQLERLRCVDLNPCRPGKFVLRTALALPTITSVLIHEFPDESFNNEDLSKVIFSCESLTTSDLSLGFKRCLDHGMKLKHLRLYKPELLDTDLRLKTLPGLEGIEFHLHSNPVSFSWLSVLSSTHPTLTKLWIFCDHNSPAPVFISSFCEDSQRQDLDRGFDVKCLVLRRAIRQSSQEWHIMSLTSLV
ncbi:hypothetical protein C8R42DRAFT_213058 [Lentinula raphanica]|nr:hypothetical protein C8R42DRAFT_213058 [Lentinula raphanica]